MVALAPAVTLNTTVRIRRSIKPSLSPLLSRMASLVALPRRTGAAMPAHSGLLMPGYGVVRLAEEAV